MVEERALFFEDDACSFVFIEVFIVVVVVAFSSNGSGVVLPILVDII